MHFVPVSGHKIIDVTYWQRSLPAEGREWHLFDFALSSVGGGIQLELDDKTIPLNGLQIDFDIEHWANPEFFVNRDQRTIESEDKRFISSPYVRVSNFGLWNN